MDNLTLLYVEDDFETVEDIMFLLNGYFDNIYIAKDGLEALELYKQHKPDVVLLDINLPKLNGLELASIIREDNALTPIMFLTAYSDSEMLMKAIDIGTSSYIVKPFKIQELREAIIKVMEKNTGKHVFKLKNDFTWDGVSESLNYKDISIILTKNEIKLIRFLCTNPFKHFTACEISSEIFPNNSKDNKCNNAVQLLSRFKSKTLNVTNSKDFFIDNVYGVGYKLVLK